MQGECEVTTEWPQGSLEPVKEPSGLSDIAQHGKMYTVPLAGHFKKAT